MSSILDSDDEKQPGPAFGPVSSDSSDDDVSPQKYRSPSDGSSSSSDISSDDGNHMKSVCFIFLIIKTNFFFLGKP